LLEGADIAIHYWLMKSEPEECSVDDALAATGATVPWTGVRNYQARNFMRDSMAIGDGVLFFHSGCEQPAIVGVAEVASRPYPDPTQFEPDSEYFDPGAKREAPRWILVDVRVLRKTAPLTLSEMRTLRSLTAMRVLQKGNRLSITPVTAAQWRAVVRLLDKRPPPSPV
jgi:predicted RNA-binding protein with PUA-like domain